MNVVWYPQALGGMPSRPVEHQDDLLVWPRARLARKCREFGLKEEDAHAGGQMEERAPGSRVHETDEVAPGVAVLHWRHGALPDRRPDPSKERLEANAMFIRRPQLHGGLRESSRDLA